MPKLFELRGENFNDFDLTVHNDALYALFIRKTPHSQNDKDAKTPNRFGLAKSEDGIQWEDLGTILSPSLKSWEQSLWAGGITRREGQFTLYYTGVTREREASSHIGRAFSSNLRTWKKDSANPILTLNSNNRYYSDEPLRCFRDPFPIIIQGKRYILIAGKDKQQPAGKRGCIGLIEETSHNQFIWHPPLFSPGTYSVLECPALYEINNRWYLLFGDDKQKVFRYAIADSPLGPFTQPMNNILLQKDYYSVRFVNFQGSWKAYAWKRDFPEGIIRERLSGPYRISQEKDGTLLV